MSFFHFLSRQLAPLTLAGAVIAYLYPPAFLIFADTFLWFFAATMLALGIVLEPSDLKRTLESPHRVLLGVLTQFTGHADPRLHRSLGKRTLTGDRSRAS